MKTASFSRLFTLAPALAIALVSACSGEQQPQAVAADDAAALRQKLDTTEEQLRLAERQLREERNRAEASPEPQQSPDFRADNEPRPDNPNPSADDSTVPPPPSGQMNATSPHGG